MTALTFRRATLDDAAWLRNLNEHAFSTNDSRPNWTGDAELASKYTLSVESIIKSLTAQGWETFVAENEAGDIIASINVGKKGDDTGRIATLIVHDDYQRGGVGGRVLAYGEDFCRREWGVTKLSLNALSSRKALLAWYKSRGYRETGETSPFPRDAPEFASIHMPEDLCFVEMDKDAGHVEDNGKAKAE